MDLRKHQLQGVLLQKVVLLQMDQRFEGLEIDCKLEEQGLKQEGHHKTYPTNQHLVLVVVVPVEGILDDVKYTSAVAVHTVAKESLLAEHRHCLV
jgi:hypothetical protein